VEVIDHIYGKNYLAYKVKSKDASIGYAIFMEWAFEVVQASKM